ncbi:flagellar hook-basal body complex protein FliE [Thermomicrobium sp. 4228-Ro]|uniref:flagellar hook-basal body complex protein FliE n=1 Tax=Thermomicrobium sp. 4228-Ro TaxID=2993937 RepID=UPI0022495C40|nr:flagellar hook-basal body complex protein FliE [Thermomicrobium sp. 4228-Ro]MCX2727808.1 flagellar hook-basal body complex protein FliE [Thermomicrobium sp. 4228-Ro]
MSISPIAPIVADITPVGAANSPTAAARPSFGQVLERAFGALNEQINEADRLAVALAAGEDVDLHQVMIALETASIGLQAALQIRNRALEAYREVMSMPI